MTNLEKLEAERDATFTEYLGVIGTGSAREKALLAKLDEIDAVLDGEEEETLNTSTNWDEWNIDHQIDMMRDMAAMAYER